MDWAGLGWAGLFKGREILDCSNTFIENSISSLRVNWCVPKTWVLSKWTWEGGGEWTKASVISL